MTLDAAKVKSIFLNAVEQCGPEDWPAYLDRECGANADLRNHVERLLAGHRQDLDLVEQGQAAVDFVLPTLASSSLPEEPGTIIGPYKLLQQIGEGGMGVVFLAEQDRPVKRRVALKVIKPGMDTREVVARFEAERQALAMMDHPNIAKVLDAGTTNVDRSLCEREEKELISRSEMASLEIISRSEMTTIGRPYFVMELVQGVPITEYCDQCNLTTRERLKLFATVCQAVQHAQQKGVIHRDLKPTNVLVAMQDGRPAPKIIDFGVAKALSQRLTEHTLMTGFAQMVGTPMYMSPEQAELSPLGVDTRSDIYSLGVLLYELLTSSTPFDRDRLHAAGHDELRRIIREEEPPRPSARLSSLSLRERAGVRETANLATTIAEKRRTDPHRLIQTVRGELDWIVMKCLEKDRNRRYESAASLARDVERYLNDEPVQACPPTVTYRFLKFAARNKSLLAAGGAIAAALVVGLGLSTWQYFRATTESARAQAVSDLLQEMLGSADAERAKGINYTVREMLDDFSAGLGDQLADQPEVEADIYTTIGRAYRSLGMPDQTQKYLERAIELGRRVYGPDSEKLAAILVVNGWNLQDLSRDVEAESQVREALEIYRKRGITGAPVLRALRMLQEILISFRHDDDAERVTQQAIAIANRSDEPFPDMASILHMYASLKTRQGKFAEAEQLARQALDMHRRLHGNGHPQTAWALDELAGSRCRWLT